MDYFVHTNVLYTIKIGTDFGLVFTYKHEGLQVLNRQRLLILFFILVGSNAAQAGRNSSVLKCLQIFNQELAQRTEPFFVRIRPSRNVDFNNTKDFLAEQKRFDAFGPIVAKYSEVHDTTFYYPAKLPPDSTGVSPMIDPRSPAVFIFLHGGGTSKGSGKNFFVQMNTLADIGISSFAIDLPFHADGPLDENFYDLDGRFFPWLDKIVNVAASSGKPVILVGHSWGSNIAYSYRLRYGKVAVLAMSWIVKHPEVDQWRKYALQRMRFFKDLMMNPTAGKYVSYFFNKTSLLDEQYEDPSTKDPRLPFHVLIGDKEEFYPGVVGGKSQNPIGKNTFPVEKEIRRRVQNAKIVIEPGIGHGLFSHKDGNGYGVVVRELLDIIGLKASDEPALRVQIGKIRNEVPFYEKVSIEYASDPLFKSWIDLTYGPGKPLVWLKQQDTFMAEKAFQEYQLALTKKLDLIYEEIRQTKTTHPEFYSANLKAIQTIVPGKRNNAFLHAYLQQVLKGEMDGTLE